MGSDVINGSQQMGSDVINGSHQRDSDVIKSEPPKGLENLEWSFYVARNRKWEPLPPAILATNGADLRKS